MAPSYRLTSSPSGGKSEVLETLRFQGANHSGVQIFRLGPMVSNRYHGDETREGSDAQWEADVVSILGQLQTAGYVAGHDAAGNNVDLTSSPPRTSWVALTGAGRVQARHPRPRPQAAPY